MLYPSSTKLKIKALAESQEEITTPLLERIRASTCQ
jgi:hypothetical protein